MSRRWLAIERVPESPFLEARASYEEAGPVLLGLPLDATVSFRPGTRFGPARIRAVSEGLESYSPVLDRDLTARAPGVPPGCAVLPRRTRRRTDP